MPIGGSTVKQRMSQFRAWGKRTRLCASALAVMALLLITCFAAQNASVPYGLTSHSKAKAYLRMPPRESGSFPPLLSQTGAFNDVSKLIPNESLIPYDV